jgi:hypothetical protein
MTDKKKKDESKLSPPARLMSKLESLAYGDNKKKKSPKKK